MRRDHFWCVSALRIDGAGWLAGGASANAGLCMHGSLWLLVGGSADVELLPYLRALPVVAGALAAASLLPNVAGIVFCALAVDAVRLDRVMHAAWVAARSHHTSSASVLRRR